MSKCETCEHKKKPRKDHWCAMFISQPKFECPVYYGIHEAGFHKQMGDFFNPDNENMQDNSEPR